MIQHPLSHLRYTTIPQLIRSRGSLYVIKTNRSLILQISFPINISLGCSPTYYVVPPEMHRWAVPRPYTIWVAPRARSYLMCSR